MNKTKYLPSLSIENVLGGNLSVDDNERFLLFLKAYYEWLETVSFKLADVSGTFVRGETVTGASGATAEIKEVRATELIVEVKTKLPFEQFETITGSTSSATATLNSFKENVVRATGNFVDNRSLETSVGNYVNYLQDELYASIPQNYFGNKRFLASKFKEYFQSKSNEQSYRFLFRLLFNEPIELYYPGEDLLRVSDGKFEKTQIIRVQAEEDIFDFLEKTIRGTSSGALGNVVDIKKFFIGSVEVAEFTLKLVFGTFSAEEMIVDIENTDLTTNTYGIITGFTINDAGSGYSFGDQIPIIGDGSEVSAIVSSIAESPIDKLLINAYGYGYRLGTDATIDNSGTGGDGLVIRVTELANTYQVISGSNTYTLGEISEIKILNRGENYTKAPAISLEDTIIKSLGLLYEDLITIDNSGNNYAVGELLTISGGDGSGAEGQVASVGNTAPYGEENLLFEDGFIIIQDNEVNGKKSAIKAEDWVNTGPILRIELTDFGTGYTLDGLPNVEIESANTTSGTDAEFTATGIQGFGADVDVDVANNTAGIGSIRAIQIIDPGINYTTATANLVSIGNGDANLTPIISGLFVSDGNFVNDDGKLDFKILQDSFFYQDFSYVIRSGIVLSTYKETIKNTIHPAGLELFGEILILSAFSLIPRITSDINSIDVPSGEVEVTIKKILTFFEGSPESRITFDYKLDFELELELVSTEHREIVVHIEAAQLDVSTAFESQIITDERGREIVVIVYGDPVNLAATAIDIEKIIRKERFTSVAFVDAFINERNVSIEIDDIVTITHTFDFNTEILNRLEIPIDRTANFDRRVELDLKSTGSFLATYGDLIIQDYADVQIQEWQAFTFNDTIEFRTEFVVEVDSDVKKNVQANGTVSFSNTAVYGTGTTFNLDYSPNTSPTFIVGNERFTVKSVTNAEFMIINVSPATNYTNATAYKQISV